MTIILATLAVSALAIIGLIAVLAFLASWVIDKYDDHSRDYKK
jgi:hypothetical protein